MKFAASIAALLATPAAFAQEVGLVDAPNLVNDRRENSEPVTETRIFLNGTVDLVCGLQLESDGATVDLTASRSLAVAFDLQCNAPFRLTGKASNGALSRTIAGTNGGFRNRLNYRVNWPALTNWGGAAVGPQLTGTASDWLEGRVATSTTPISPVSGEFTISWDDPRNLLAGQYDETLTVEIQLIN